MTLRTKLLLAASALATLGWVFWFTTFPPKQVKPLAPLMSPPGYNISEAEEHCFNCHGKAICDPETMMLINMATKDCMTQTHDFKMCVALKARFVGESCLVEK